MEWIAGDLEIMASTFTYSNPGYYILLSNPSILQVSSTSVYVVASLINLDSVLSIPDRFVVMAQKLLSNGQVDGSSPETTYNATYAQSYDPQFPDLVKILVTGLSQGGTYRFKLQDYKNNIIGNTITIPSHTLSVSTGAVTSTIGNMVYYTNSNGASATAVSSNAAIQTYANLATTLTLTPGKSYLKLSNANSLYKKGSYNLAYKQFINSITLPTVTSTSTVITNGITQISNSYSTQTYTFGTSVILNNIVGQENSQGAGFGFFVDPVSGDGYYLTMITTGTASAIDRQSVEIIKVKGSSKKRLASSQIDPSSTINLVTGGVSYDIDIKVKVYGVNTEIKASINGYDITAIDKPTVSTDPKNSATEILAPTNNIALLCLVGEAAFDYAYASDITIAQYKDPSYESNFYKGQFSNDLINSFFGNLLYISNYLQDEITAKSNAYDEFGTTVREIVLAKVKFDNPSYPIGVGLGTEDFVKMIGYKFNNWGAEIYILNNVSTTVPLEDGETSSFYIYGNTIGQSGTIEYVSNEIPENITPEQITLESKWLQNLKDVESLGSWIKNKVLTVGKVVTMKVFGNPLISVGDIVTINYSYQGFNGTQKLIITSVSHSYSEGLETTVTCRTL